ncbi:(2Fe-2S)-binding protein [Solirubrobacter soli]|uniref:(2Fe-2S)-binding protein n=1 Tax=Solirubrobacter soli TaxID=363832 RepID=UPI00040DD1E0|nr:(2Fe-2S)-binding protein [Solirubrobacter soli]
MDGWATTAELAGPRLHDALKACGDSLNTDRPDIQGQRLVEVVTWVLAEPIATALINDEPLPDLHPDHVEFWIGEDMRIRRHAEATFDGAPDEHITAHLTPLIEAVNATTKRPTKALWRAVKDRTDGAIAWIAETTGKRQRAFELLHDRAELRMLDLRTHEMLLHVREGCCLYYRTPANVKCFGCPLLDDEERRRLSGVA